MLVIVCLQEGVSCLPVRLVDREPVRPIGVAETEGGAVIATAALLVMTDGRQ